jgi:hypothetical protein
MSLRTHAEPLWKIDGASHSVWTYVKEQENESI